MQERRAMGGTTCQCGWPAPADSYGLNCWIWCLSPTSTHSLKMYVERAFIDEWRTWNGAWSKNVYIQLTRTRHFSLRPTHLSEKNERRKWKPIPVWLRCRVCITGGIRALASASVMIRRRLHDLCAYHNKRRKQWIFEVCIEMALSFQAGYICFVQLYDVLRSRAAEKGSGL